MKWKKFKIKTVTDAEDIIISTLYDIGLEGAQINGGKAAGLRPPQGHGGVQRFEGRLRLDARLQELPQQPAGEGGLLPGPLAAAHAVRQQQT